MDGIFGPRAIQIAFPAQTVCNINNTIMELSLPQALLSFILLYIIYNFYLLQTSIRLAHRIGLPYVIFPVSSENTLFTLLMGIPIIRQIISLSPLWLSDRIFSQCPVTRWRVKYRKAERFGGVHCVATPGGVTVEVMDATVMYEVMSERERFVKEIGKYGTSWALSLE